VTGDAFGWLRTNATRYDAVIVDLPDPDETATAKLYSVEFYALAARALTPGGRMVVQAGSPYFARSRSGASTRPCAPRRSRRRRTTSTCHRSATGDSRSGGADDTDEARHP